MEDGLAMNKQDVNMFDGIGDGDTKTKRQNLKRTNEQVAGNDKYIHVNKGKVEKSKVESKKAYKDAKKRSMLNKQKGIVKENGIEESKALRKAQKEQQKV